MMIKNEEIINKYTPVEILILVKKINRKTIPVASSTSGY
jgi:hypothetical protein